MNRSFVQIERIPKSQKSVTIYELYDEQLTELSKFVAGEKIALGIELTAYLSTLRKMHQYDFHHKLDRESAARRTIELLGKSDVLPTYNLDTGTLVEHIGTSHRVNRLFIYAFIDTQSNKPNTATFRGISIGILTRINVMRNVAFSKSSIETHNSLFYDLLLQIANTDQLDLTIFEDRERVLTRYLHRVFQPNVIEEIDIPYFADFVPLSSS